MISVLSVIKLIWKTINVFRQIFLNIIFFIAIILIFSGIELIKDLKKQDVVPQYGTLVLDLEGVIVDSTRYDDEIYALQNKIYGKKVNTSRENSLFELTQKIAQATTDPNIDGMVLKLDNFVGADMSSLQYVGKYLSKFREANKPIYAIGSNFNQSQYYLASYANKIYLTPLGAVSVYGLSANNLYYKTLLDNLKINTHVFRVGTYKSAIEPFIRDDMSDAAKSNTTRWLSAMWENYLNDISVQRKKAPSQLVPNPDDMLSELKASKGSMSQYALSTGLVDVVASNYQYDLDIVQNQHQLSIYDYKLTEKDEQTDDKPLIAVVFVNGTITDSENNTDIAGSLDIVEQLRNIRNNLDNQNVQAVILRVNSPGGSVDASEAIRSELEALRSYQIPVVVSMGGMAASGGYWISTASDYIIASPNTITGSIGIFGIIPTFEKSLSHIGVYNDGVATSPLANNSVTRNLPDEMSQLIQMNIDNGYNTFISLVAKARNMSTEQVDKIAQGQVWLGSEASNIGLVDKLGDFDDAIETAATLANLTDYKIDWLKPDVSWFNSFYSEMLTMLPKSTAEIFFDQLPQAKQLKQQVSLWNKFHDSQNRYIYCLNCADVR
ncbi:MULTISPECIES: signal peptide peptidase SppA [unclassified Gilliamella]|uniref:signal peptide peptidase SppA n=1 Tax=unclassified Gilliamella TaxID=2685620 RepID=UPI00226AA86C|nr:MULTISPECIES: signal peptide peptidase SppA [unclassified Gilliamella]MCX8642047.1 signal peptide peptidase SppA [Gilliamella sp. B3835]MCX8707233.1 signal peptide peptidase SppA [Gilliamella sp. B3783]MCX8710858.1 signal peptide peptidase SppA [Gilliamella sp. B3780]MCX8714026.1 signal peptide peptidase SppA [Gilliamella sp. B3781]MCX8716215.1 signal peptide peptidase SppA [Gilliamella sp. B3784]